MLACPTQTLIELDVPCVARLLHARDAMQDQVCSFDTGLVRGVHDVSLIIEQLTMQECRDYVDLEDTQVRYSTFHVDRVESQDHRPNMRHILWHIRGFWQNRICWHMLAYQRGQDRPLGICSRYA